MKSSKGKLQKAVTYTGFASFLAAIACLVFLYLRLDGAGWDDLVSASLMASSFFFVSVGFVLVVIGKCDLPSFKVGP
ncbi:MAG: hypothetical protein WBN96_01365 [Gammaproteobacteria bacterium]